MILTYFDVLYFVYHNRMNFDHSLEKPVVITSELHRRLTYTKNEQKSFVTFTRYFALQGSGQLKVFLKTSYRVGSHSSSSFRRMPSRLVYFCFSSFIKNTTFPTTVFNLLTRSQRL